MIIKAALKQIPVNSPPPQQIQTNIVGRHTIVQRAFNKLHRIKYFFSDHVNQEHKKGQK